MSDHLLREHAPISDGAWAAIEDDVTPKLKTQLAARKLVDFTGPGGWDLSSVNMRPRPSHRRTGLRTDGVAAGRDAAGRAARRVHLVAA